MYFWTIFFSHLCGRLRIGKRGALTDLLFCDKLCRWKLVFLITQNPIDLALSLPGFCLVQLYVMLFRANFQIFYWRHSGYDCSIILYGGSHLTYSRLLRIVNGASSEIPLIKLNDQKNYEILKAVPYQIPSNFGAVITTILDLELTRNS